MDINIQFGASERGKPTAIYRNYEYWYVRMNSNGESSWRCCKYPSLGCKARLKTIGSCVVGNIIPEHCHEGNVITALARKAVGEMKVKMTELAATPRAVQGTVELTLSDNVLMALPKKSTLSRTLQRHRQKENAANCGSFLPPIPTDLNFVFPAHFDEMMLFDSGPGEDRLIILGSNLLLDGLARADLWLADGTFKVVPSIFFQLYTIHFEFVPGINPVGLYCLLTNKNRATYDRLLQEIKRLIPTANPKKVLVDFETATMSAFGASFPAATITGCYFHLCQSIIRKVNGLGIKEEYENNDAIRGSIRCLAALAYVPVPDVVNAFELLAESMPAHEHMDELLTYFEHTYVRGRRLRGRGNNYGSALYPIDSWNQNDAAFDGIARTTNIVEGWHYGLQALFQCHHPTLWTFLEGLQKDSKLHASSFLQGVSGVQHNKQKKYKELNEKVRNAVARYGRVEVLTYLQAIAHLSHT